MPNSDGRPRVLMRTVLPALALTLTNVAVGRALVARSAQEERTIRRLQRMRTPARDRVARVVSTVSDVPASVGIAAVSIPVLRGLGLPWRRALAPALAMALETVVYLAAGFAVKRPRPAVPRLDRDQPTPSFPSGHVGANVALLVVAGRLAADLRSPLARGLVQALGVGYPAALAPARVYVGMHYPSDVIAGVVNGVVCGLLAWDALGREPTPDDPVRGAGGQWSMSVRKSKKDG